MNQWNDLNILQESRNNIMKSVVAEMEKELVDQNYLVWPVVKFSPGKVNFYFFLFSFFFSLFSFCFVFDINSRSLCISLYSITLNN